MSVLKDLSDAMAQAVETVGASLVQVNARRRLPATGIIWSADGVIVTTNHIVERDDNITVTLNDGSTHEAKLIGRDPQNDLAVLQVSGELTPAHWGDDEALKVGNLVLALGRPGEQVQATLGVVSALVSSPVQGEREERRRRHKRGGRRMAQVLVDGYIQTDVVMYPGFSGGALVSGDGVVHGINTSGFGRGASITVPVATIRNTVNTLRQHGKMKQGYLGVGVQAARLPDAIAQELEQETGLLVVSVENDSPAAHAGLFVGDILVAVDDNSTEQLDELLSLLTGDRVGKSIPVQIVRGGALHDLSVTIGERS
ncbi:MAG: trypsin-like peptidase domain-containing protein [Phototrophicaceae bacterium]